MTRDDKKRAREREYARKNKARKRRIHDTYFAKLKQQILDAYGRTCVCCGESNPLFLTLDHVNGNGNASMKAVKKGGRNYYGWVRAQGFPAGYQTMCFNCNCSKGKGDCCAHELDQWRVMAI